jgi:hypothetical protein
MRAKTPNHNRLGLRIAETRAPPAFCAELPVSSAQNPVTLLWTACTPLKTNQINSLSFH